MSQSAIRIPMSEHSKQDKRNDMSFFYINILCMFFICDPIKYDGKQKATVGKYLLYNYV